MATNLQLLINAGLILQSNMPSTDDVNTINALPQSDVQGLIDVFNTVGAGFLERNCNVTSVLPGQSRTIGIVF